MTAERDVRQWAWRSWPSAACESETMNVWVQSVREERWSKARRIPKELCVSGRMQWSQLRHEPDLSKRTPVIINEGRSTTLPPQV